MPNLRGWLQKDFPILEEYGVQADDKALQQGAAVGRLPGDQPDEALVAIDVNTGRYVGKRTGRLEHHRQTNLEASRKSGQLRLRDPRHRRADLIDMEEKKNRQNFRGREGAAGIPRRRGAAGIELRSGDRDPPAVKQSLGDLTEPLPMCWAPG